MTQTRIWELKPDRSALFGGGLLRPYVVAVGVHGLVTAMRARAFGVSTPPVSGDLRPPTGTFPNQVRYEDLAGANLQAKLNTAGGMVSTATMIVVTFPPGDFTFSDFSQSRSAGAQQGFGLRVPSNVAIAGSNSVGVNATIFKMVADSSTVGTNGEVPQPGSGLTNNYSLICSQNSGSLMPPNGMVFQNFAIYGTHQVKLAGQADALGAGHLYNGLRFGGHTGLKLTNVYIEGIPGDQAAPPGETFAVNVYHGTGIIVDGLEVDGRRTRQGNSAAIGASPFGFNSHNCTGARISNSYFHHCPFSMPTTWDDTSTSGAVWTNCRSEFNKTGWNHERVLKATHINPTILLGGVRPHHTTMMNDLADGMLIIQNPTWDAGTASATRLVVYMGPRGTGVVDKQVTAPVVTDANGNSIMSQVLVATT